MKNMPNAITKASGAKKEPILINSYPIGTRILCENAIFSRRESTINIQLLKAIPILLLFAFTSSCGSVQKDRTSRLHQERRFKLSIDFEKPDYQVLNDAIFLATNEARKFESQRPVQRNQKLEQAASSYAKRQAKGNFLAHIDPTGGPKTPDDRVRVFKGKNPYVSENLATTAGYPIDSGEPVYVDEANRLSREPDGPKIARHTYLSFAREVVQQWLDSPGHRKNLLSPDALELGCGTYIFFQNKIPSFVSVQNFQSFEPLK